MTWRSSILALDDAAGQGKVLLQQPHACWRFAVGRAGRVDVCHPAELVVLENVDALQLLVSRRRCKDTIRKNPVIGLQIIDLFLENVHPELLTEKFDDVQVVCHSWTASRASTDERIVVQMKVRDICDRSTSCLPTRLPIASSVAIALAVEASDVYLCTSSMNKKSKHDSAQFLGSDDAGMLQRETFHNTAPPFRHQGSLDGERTSFHLSS